MPLFNQNEFWKLAERLGLFITVIDKLFQGKDMPEGTPDKLKGLSGLFGTKDERLMEALYQRLDSGTPGESRKIQDFIAWCTKHDNTPVKIFEAFVIRNRFTDYVTTLDNPSSGNEVGSEETKFVYTDPADKKVTVTKTIKEKKFSAGGSSVGLNLLREIVKEIDTQGTNATSYRKVLKFCKGRKMPLRKVGEPGFFRWMENHKVWMAELVKKYNETYPAVAPHLSRIQQEAGWWFEDQARRADAKWRITPQVWRTADGTLAWRQIMGKIVTLPHNIFMWAFEKLMPF